MKGVLSRADKHHAFSSRQGVSEFYVATSFDTIFTRRVRERNYCVRAVDVIQVMASQRCTEIGPAVQKLRRKRTGEIADDV